MTLGQRLRQARLEAGLSQRQLCGDTITRNMLSQIENGTAAPSMGTLKTLADRLNKPVSYFLEEQTVTSPNQETMEKARNAYKAGNFSAAAAALEDYRSPDPVFDPEYGLLKALCAMAMAERAIRDCRFPYAARLLAQAEQAGRETAYYTPDLERKRLLLLGKTGQEIAGTIAGKLPELDTELLLRAEAALQGGDFLRCARLLDAAEDRQSPRWNLLRGEAYFAQKDYAAALPCYTLAENAYPRQALPRLEVCCRELGDFKGAYEYACRQR